MHMFIVILFTFHLLQTLCVIQGPYEIRDLFFQGSLFISDANQWRILDLNTSSNRSNIYCDNYYLGGLNVLLDPDTGLPSFERTYTDLPTHTKVFFTMKFILVGDWTGNDMVNFVFGSMRFDNKLSDIYLKDSKYTRCEHNPTLILWVKGLFVHDASSLVFTISKADSTTGDPRGFGFREISFLFQDADPTSLVLGSPFCLHVDVDLMLPDPDSQCPCGKNEYEVAGTCGPCDGSCSFCFDAFSTNCYSCSEGYFYDGQFCDLCASGCASCKGVLSEECTSCKEGYLLYKNRRCVANNTCIYPLVASDYFCDLPCPENHFLYWDGSCFSKCPSPLVDNPSGDVLQCLFPCSDKLLFLESGCRDSCNSPYFKTTIKGKPACILQKCPHSFALESINRTCTLCSSTACTTCNQMSEIGCEDCLDMVIMDSNSICRECSALKIEYIRPIRNGHQYTLKLEPNTCDLDQVTVQNFLQATEAAQNMFSPFSFEVTRLSNNTYQVNLLLQKANLQENNLDITLNWLNGTMRVPKTFITSPTLQAIAEMAPSVQKSLTYMMAPSLGGTLALGATAALWSLLNFEQFLRYFVYINIDYPPQVELFLSLFQSMGWDFLPNPFSFMINSFDQEVLQKDEALLEEYKAPARLAANGVKSFFMQNAGSIIAVNFGLLLLLGIVLLAIRISVIKNNRFLRIIKINLRWNIIIRVLLENGVPLSLALFLQFRVLSFSRTYPAICSIMTIVMTIYLLIMLIWIIRIVSRRQVSHLNKSLIKKLYGTLYEGMELTNDAAKYYHIIILFRGIMIAAVATFAEDLPLLQIILPIYYNLGLTYYLFRKVKFESKVLNIINRTKETLITFSQIFILCLCVKTDSAVYYDIMGWLIVAFLGIALLVEMVYIIYLQLLSVKHLILKIKRFVDSFRIGGSKPENRVPRSRNLYMRRTQT